MLQGEILSKLREIDNSETVTVTEWEAKFLARVFENIEVKKHSLSAWERDKAMEIIGQYEERL